MFVGHDANRFVAPGTRRATIAEVVADAGVSRATVSQVLNGKRPVAPPTRDRVLASVERLHYRPHSVARSLRTQRSLTIGLVLPDVTNPFYPELTRAFQDVAYGRSYHTIICNTDGDAEREREAVRDLLDRQVDGVMLATFGLSGPDIDAISAVVPTAFIGDPAGAQMRPGPPRRRRGGSVWPAGCSERATAGSASWPALRVRGLPTSGWRGSWRRAGRTTTPAPGTAAVGEYSRRGASAPAKPVRAADPPDGIWCANDQIAIGALRGAKDSACRSQAT